jgi:hypothetical protein
MRQQYGWHTQSEEVKASVWIGGAGENAQSPLLLNKKWGRVSDPNSCFERLQNKLPGAAAGIY